MGPHELIATGHAVVEAAGGQAVELNSGEPLRYNSRLTLPNPEFMACGDPDSWRRWPRGAWKLHTARAGCYFDITARSPFDNSTSIIPVTAMS
jgi:hypothetical protein